MNWPPATSAIVITCNSICSEKAAVPKSRSYTLPPRAVLPLVGLITALGLFLRWPGIDRSLGHDELYTIVIFATRSWGDILTGYDLPNNHIFHTLLLRLSQSLFGDAEWALRLPALAAGAASLPAIYALARRLTGIPTVGLLAALMLGSHHLHVNFSQQARGYTLMVLLCILYADALWWALQRTLKSASQNDATGWQLGGSAILPWFLVVLSG